MQSKKKTRNPKEHHKKFFYLLPPMKNSANTKVSVCTLYPNGKEFLAI